MCSEQLVTGDDENTQIRLKYKYKHTQKDKKWPKSCFGSDIASQQRGVLLMITIKFFERTIEKFGGPKGF